VPANRHAQAMAKRLATHGKNYFTFVTTPGVQPTNNLAEQAIRFVVLTDTSRRGREAREGSAGVSDLDGDSDMHAAGSQACSTTCNAAVKAYFGTARRHRCCRRVKEEHGQASEATQTRKVHETGSAAAHKAAGQEQQSQESLRSARRRTGAKRPQDQGVLGKVPARAHFSTAT